MQEFLHSKNVLLMTMLSLSWFKIFWLQGLSHKESQLEEESIVSVIQSLVTNTINSSQNMMKTNWLN